MSSEAIYRIDVLRQSTNSLHDILVLNTRKSFFSFSEERIRNGSKKLAKARSTTQQGRLDKFFTVSRTVTAKTSSPKKSEAPIVTIKGLKRKIEPASEAKPKGKPAGSSAKKAKVK
ncbi:unnamed protein product [Adineta ricciae]|uniref:Uncharacterized protein n=1 Tax=Adineta ricciae TaxID=249248 RepID=A0A814LFP4_ADIRI|nr:unnamed protein product [Adineta ricciae]